MKKYQSFLSENFQFLEVKFSIYLNRRVFVMFTELNFEFKKKKKKKKNNNKKKTLIVSNKR